MSDIREDGRLLGLNTADWLFLIGGVALVGFFVAIVMLFKSA